MKLGSHFQRPLEPCSLLWTTDCSLIILICRYRMRIIMKGGSLSYMLSVTLRPTWHERARMLGNCSHNDCDMIPAVAEAIVTVVRCNQMCAGVKQRNHVAIIVRFRCVVSFNHLSKSVHLTVATLVKPEPRKQPLKHAQNIATIDRTCTRSKTKITWRRKDSDSGVYQLKKPFFANRQSPVKPFAMRA